MSVWQKITTEIKNKNKKWLVTGAAGFIGSHLMKELLLLDQNVIGFDNFATGYKKNLEDVTKSVSVAQAKRFSFIEGDIRDLAMCTKACRGVDYVLHQAALGSVPRSIDEPLLSHAVNVDGFVNMLLAARDAKVSRFVYASSSAIYGDHPGLPKHEPEIGNALSPYAVTKRVNELYAANFSLVYKLQTVGLRYFNVFGARQDPNGAYAAVIPRWIEALVKKRDVVIYGDGSTTRDFCFVQNVVQANILAAVTTNQNVSGKTYNIACGDKTSLLELSQTLAGLLAEKFTYLKDFKPKFEGFRAGDIQHSLADVSLATSDFGYAPTHNLKEGLKEALSWYVQNL